MQLSPIPSFETTSVLTVGVTHEVQSQSLSKRSSQQALDDLMLGLINRFRAWNILKAITYRSGQWELVVETGQTFPVRVAAGRDKADQMCLVVTRDGASEIYQFRDQAELEKIIPSHHDAFLDRWKMTEGSFAARLPRSIARNSGFER